MDKYGAIEDEIQKIQNTGLRKILGAFRSAPIKAMQRDAEYPAGEHKNERDPLSICHPCHS